MGLPGDAALYAAALSNSETVTLDAGREPWLEEPDAFFATVRRFLRDRLSVP